MLQRRPTNNAHLGTVVLIEADSVTMDNVDRFKWNDHIKGKLATTRLDPLFEIFLNDVDALAGES